MALLVFAIIVLIVAALFVAAVGYVDMIPGPFNRLIQALIIIIAALVILNKAGLV